MYKLEAYTDGACSGNPGPGGWGAILIAKKDNIIVKKKKYAEEKMKLLTIEWN